MILFLGVLNLQPSRLNKARELQSYCFFFFFTVTVLMLLLFFLLLLLHCYYFIQCMKNILRCQILVYLGITHTSQTVRLLQSTTQPLQPPFSFFLLITQHSLPDEKMTLVAHPALHPSPTKASQKLNASGSLWNVRGTRGTAMTLKALTRIWRHSNGNRK